MTNYTQREDLSSAFALSIFEDKKGELWVGMANGRVYTFDGETFEKQF